jgi:glutathione S-transferase
MLLVIGNKRYSSWSMRPWIAMKAAGIAFEEKLVQLRGPDFKAEVGRYSPAGRVPVIVDGEITVWDTLAILEYLAETHPEARLWPADRAARAHARAISAEMHAGFAAMREHWTCNYLRPPKPRASPIPDQVFADARRVEDIFRTARERFGRGGPFLFGAGFSAADAMYAPVVGRLHHYAAPVSADTRAYIDAVMALPAWAEWVEGAKREPADWRLDDNELD